MDPKIAKKTQNTLGKVISKPPLTDKLLGKPPFRFLHDVTTSVIKTTGFMNGLFTDSELNSENVKEKETKVAFLQKAIDMVSLVTGKSLAVRPQKIVAGHEPEKTNEFLQVLAEAIKMKVNNDEYVKKLLKGKGGGGGAETKDKEKDKEKESRSRSADKRKKESEEKKDKGRDDKEKSRDREKSRDKEKEKSRDEGKDREKSRDRDKDRSRDRDKDREHRRKKHELRQDGSGRSEESHSDKESQDEEMTQLQAEGRVKIRRKHSSTKQEESTSTDEKHKESTKANLSSRSRADRPRGARRRSERPMPVMKRGDESSDDESANSVSFKSHEVDKKRKTGIKSRLGVRNEKERISSDHSARRDSVNPPRGTKQLETKQSGTKQLETKQSGTKQLETKQSGTKQLETKQSGTKQLGTKQSGTKQLETKQSGTKQLETKQSGKSLSRSNSKSSSSTLKRDIASSSRRKLTDSKGKDSPTTPKTPGDARVPRRSSQTAPDKRRKSSFTMMPHLMNASQRDEPGKENESPAGDKMVNGEEHNKQETHTRLQRPTSAKGSRRRREGRRAADSEEGGSLPPYGMMEEDEEFVQKQEPAVGEADLPPQVANARRIARPSSARPAPPRPKQDGVESEPAMRLGSGHPTNVIVDNGQQSDEDDENFLVEESAPPPPEPEPTVLSKQEGEDDAEHGALVKKMLETKKEFEEGSQPQQSGPPKKTEIERPAMSDAARRKQREIVQKEINKLRNSIQSLTRSANPLGKIMDYVQEDLDSMQKELEKWKSENKEHSLALKRERGITDRSVEPLKAQLSELDQAIKDQLDLIAATKSNIIRNDQKIDKMLKSIAKS